jgi:hypothetical protein
MDESSEYKVIKSEVYRKNYQLYAKIYNKKMMGNYKHPIDIENLPETDFSY